MKLIAPNIPVPVREPTQARTTPWPFLYSLDPGRGLVRNVEVVKTERVLLLRDPTPRTRAFFWLGQEPTPYERALQAVGPALL